MRPWPRQTRRRLAVGGVLAAAVVVLLLATIFARQLLRRQPATHPLVVVFPRGADFRPGSPVWMAGVPVGVVHGVDFIPPREESDPHLALQVAIDTAYWDLLRVDSDAGAAMPRLLQRIVVLEIVPGSAASPVLLPGDTLRARPAVSLDRLAADVRKIRPGVDSLLANGRRLEQTVRGRSSELSRLENGLKEARAELDLLGTSIRQGPLHRLMADRATRDRLERIRASVEAVATALEGRRATIQPAAERLAKRAELVIAAISEVEALLEEPSGSAPRAVHDAAIQRAIERMRAQIDSLVTQLRRQPFRFLF